MNIFIVYKGEDIKAAWSDFVENGSDQAFYVLYSHYHNYLLYIALQKGVLPEHAKDKVNDLFLYVFTNRATLHKINHFHNYLVTSFLHNLFRKDKDLSRQSERLSEKEETIPDEAAFPAWDQYFTHAGTERTAGVSQMIKSYVDKLSNSQAKMIYQKFYLGMSYAEIANVNDVSIKTVYNTILRAVSRLKDLIGEEVAETLKAAVFSLGSLFLLQAGLLLLTYSSFFS